MRRRGVIGLAGLVVVACLAAYAVWYGGRTVSLPGDEASPLEPTPACTPLADVTPAACAIPDLTEAAPPGLSVPVPDSSNTPTAEPTVVLLLPLTEGGPH